MQVSQRQGLFGGVAILSFATLVLQITLTRLYSALFGNHLAFLAISLSLFGIGLGGVLLYMVPALARPPALWSRLSQLSAITAMVTVVAVVFVVKSKPVETLDTSSLARLTGLYLLSSAPFVLVGIAVAAALRYAAADVSKLYLYDLLGEAEQEVEERDYDKLTFAIQRLLEFMLADDLRHPKAERNIARRVVALAWTLNPGYFEGSPSLTEVAHMMGLNKVTLSDHAAGVRRVFGVRNRAQSHGWNFKPQKVVAQEVG